MKTLNQLRKLVNYKQPNDQFLEYLTKLQEHGVIKPTLKDIVLVDGNYEVSDDLYMMVADVFGIELDDDLNAVRLPDLPNE